MTLLVEEEAPEADEGEPAAGSGGRLAVLVVAGLLAALHLWLAWQPAGPSLLWDGLGYLGNARWLGGADATPWLGPLSFYHAGYSLLLVPATVLSDDPNTVHRWALVVNAAGGVGSFLVLVHLARSFLGLAVRPAVAAAAVAALYPPLVLQTGFEWSESVFAAAFAGTVALLWRYARHRSVGATVLVCAGVAGLHLVHPRALPLLVIMAVTLLLGLLGRRTGAPAVAAGLATLAVAHAGTSQLHDVMRASIYQGRGGREAELLGLLLDPSEWSHLALRAVGQVWYLLVATAGVAAVGVAVLVVLARRDGPESEWRGSRRLVASWLLAAVAAIGVASVLQAAGGSRVDHQLYGRYVEAAAPLLLLVGVGGLFGLVSRRLAATGLASGAALAGVGGALLWQGGAESFSGRIAPMNIFGVMTYADVGADPPSVAVLQASVAVAVAALVLAAVALRWPAVAVGLVAVASLGVIVDLEQRVAAPFRASAQSAFVLGPTIAEADPEDVAMSEEAYRMVAMNEYQHENPDVRFDVVASPLAAEHDLVVHVRQWPEAIEAGARRLAIEPAWDLGVWVHPGPVQERLDAAGLLEPEPEPEPVAEEVASPTTTEPPPTTVPPEPPPTPERGDGTFHVTEGESAVVGTGALRRFTVEVEGGIGEDPAAFAAAVESTLLDDRSWAGGSAGGTPIAFQRVSGGPVDVRVVLASPATTDELCAPLRTNRLFSCHQGGRAVVNLFRWREGAPPSGLDLDDYRRYVVNHEVGHAIGHGHPSCPVAGAPAPVMMQQTKGIGACAPNAWPLPEERGSG